MTNDINNIYRERHIKNKNKRKIFYMRKSLKQKKMT